MDIMINELLQSAVDAGFGSSRGDCIADILVSMAGTSVRGKVFSRLRKVSYCIPTRLMIDYIPDLSPNFDITREQRCLVGNLRPHPPQRHASLQSIRMLRCSTLFTRNPTLPDSAYRLWTCLDASNDLRTVYQYSSLARFIPY